MSNNNVVLVLGAGATVSDVATRPLIHRPPLDKGFFRIAKLARYRQVDKVNSYMKDVYDIDILKPEHDSLEKIMATIYSDIFDPSLDRNASGVFRTVIQLFNKRLADTTNNIPPTRQRYLYRILVHYLLDDMKNLFLS